MLIVKKECPDQFHSFRKCMDENSSKPEVCLSIREEMFTCGRQGFVKANTDPSYTYWLKINPNLKSSIWMISKLPTSYYITIMSVLDSSKQNTIKTQSTSANFYYRP